MCMRVSECQCVRRVWCGNGLCEVTHTICIIWTYTLRCARSEYELELTWWFCRFCIAPSFLFGSHRLRFIFRTQIYKHRYIQTSIHTAYVLSYYRQLSIVFLHLYCWLVLSPIRSLFLSLLFSFSFSFFLLCVCVCKMFILQRPLWNEVAKANFS